MKLTEITIPVGAVSSFRMLHMSDNHISLADERNDDRKNALAVQRANAFTGGHPERLQQFTEELIGYARKGNLPILHTGDMSDFVSEANLDYVRTAFSGVDVFCAAGNHEYSQYVGEAWEDEAYKAMSFAAVLDAYPGNIWFQTRVINGVKFVAIETITTMLQKNSSGFSGKKPPTVCPLCCWYTIHCIPKICMRR